MTNNPSPSSDDSSKPDSPNPISNSEREKISDLLDQGGTKDGDDPKQRYRQKATNLIKRILGWMRDFNFWVALGTWALAIVGGLALKSSDDALNEQLKLLKSQAASMSGQVNSLRAVIVLDSIQLNPTIGKNTGELGWQFGARWINDGNTPTNTVTAGIACISRPPHDDAPISWKWLEDKIAGTTVVLGQKQVSEIEACSTMTPKVVAEGQSSDWVMYVGGEARPNLSNPARVSACLWHDMRHVMRSSSPG